MTDQIPAPASGCCQHYPNRVLRKRDLARELGVCDKTIDNLVEGGKLPQPCSLNSIAVWMLYDVHDFISAASKALTSARDREPTKEATSSEETQDTKKAKKPAHKAGKYSV